MMGNIKMQTYLLVSDDPKGYSAMQMSPQGTLYHLSIYFIQEELFKRPSMVPVKGRAENDD